MPPGDVEALRAALREVAADEALRRRAWPPAARRRCERGRGRPQARPLHPRSRGGGRVTFTAVVVLHDSEPELRVLLDSLERHLAEPPQLVVVDSGSRDGGAALARARGAEVIELPDNPGFGAASNAGLARARHDVTVLLNPDCELLDGSLAALAALARAHPRALHAPRLLNADGSVQRSAHPLPGTRGALLPALVHPPLLPRALRERAEPHRADRAHGRLGDRRLPGRAHRHAAAARPVRPGRAPVRRGHGAVPARPRRRHPDRPAPASCASGTRAGTPRCATGEPYELLARRRREAVGRHARRRGRSRSTTSPRRSRSPPARPVTRCSAATPSGRARSSPRCGGRGGSRAAHHTRGRGAAVAARRPSGLACGA